MRIKEIKDFSTVKKEDDINIIIEKLNSSPYKILFVVEENKLVGTITDGDLRRYLFNRKNDILKAKAYNIMNSQFKYIFVEDYKKLTLKDYLELKVEYIPIVNENMEIIRVINIPINFQELSNLKTKVLIMAGGKGTRLYPLTKVIPKPLVPYKDKTIIEQIMEQFIKSGFDEFILSVNYKKELIKDYFSNSKYKVEYIEENEFLGTAGSISYLKFYNINNPFFVANCDVLLDVDFKEILEYHKSEKADITIVSAKQTVDIAYGVLVIDENNNFKEISEKPSYEFYVNTGIYILSPNIIDLISLNEKIDMPELLERARKNGKKIKVYKTGSKMIDIGKWDYYKELL
jgi:dTDP-glucose pyrophosphorylase